MVFSKEDCTLGEHCCFLRFRNFSLQTNIMMCLLIACILGPMVYATCFCAISLKNLVKELGFAGKLSLHL